MKSRFPSMIAAAGFVLALATACPAQPMVVSPVLQPPIARNSVPAPVVPRRYVWDGTQLVGRSGSQYFYLGPNNTWMIMDGIRLRRFQQWQRANPNWQQRQVRNNRFFKIQPPPMAWVPPRAPVAPVSYVWDGTQFIGMSGGQFYYLGPNNVWMVPDGVRMGRFQRWQRANPNWQQRQIRNTRYFQMQPMPNMMSPMR